MVIHSWNHEMDTIFLPFPIILDSVVELESIKGCWDLHCQPWLCRDMQISSRVFGLFASSAVVLDSVVELENIKGCWDLCS